jgi:hypothetical protein
VVGVRPRVGVRLGAAALGDGADGLEKVVGVRLGVGARRTDGADVEGLLTPVERRGAVGADRLRVTTRFRDRLEIDGVERRMLEDELRVGMDRFGVGRETDREGARLGAGADFAGGELLFCLAWLRLLLRELRREVWASTASDSSKIAATTRATRAVLQL